MSSRDFGELVNKRIERIRHDNGTTLVFETDDGVFGYRAEGDCCSSSWFEHTTGAALVTGQIVRQVTEVPMDEPEDTSEYDCLQVYGYEIKTDAGSFVIEMRNDSNGYYGGFISGPFTPSSVEQYAVLTEDV